MMILESLSFTETLYAFDFDGTLAKIVRDPAAAAMTRTTEGLLRRLACRAPVAIVSGRSVSDLRKRLGFEPPFLIGNHGLEGLGKSVFSLDRARAACVSWGPALEKVDWQGGVEIEDKTYSLALHYRKSRHKQQAKEQIQEALSRLRPRPRVLAGKSVVNVIPEGAPHKGMALLELMRKTQVRHAFYIGDDDTDEDVFSLPETRIMTVRVGYKKSSHAQFYIERQSEVSALLKRLVHYYDR